MKVRVTRYKLELTGPLRVSRNPFPSQTRDICLLSLIHPGISKDQQPQVKSAVVSKGSQKQGSSCSTPPGFQEQAVGQGGKTSNKTSGLTNLEKLELREKPY